MSAVKHSPEKVDKMLKAVAAPINGLQQQLEELTEALIEISDDRSEPYFKGAYRDPQINGFVSQLIGLMQDLRAVESNAEANRGYFRAKVKGDSGRPYVKLRGRLGYSYER